VTDTANSYRRKAMENLVDKLRRVHKSLTVAMSGVLVIALSATALAVPKERIVGHGHGHAHSFISTCNPRHFPSGAVCWTARTGELVTLNQEPEATDTTNGGKRFVTRAGPLPNAKVARPPSVVVPRGNLGLPISLGLVALIGAAVVMVLHRRSRAF
jgi:hypothetical protein